MPQLPLDLIPLDSENPYVLVPLHQYPEFTFQCATLLNIEWPRSRQASKNFPVGMVLVQTDVKEAIGFCKISLIPNVKSACFVESVVIQPKLRGKGLGSLLMKQLENYVLSRKLDTIYLSTLGQEKFYKKLGFDECEPVSLYSFGLNAASTAPLSDTSNVSETSKNGLCEVHSQKKKPENCDGASLKGNSDKAKSSIPPPPPLPQPKPTSGKNGITAKKGRRKASAYLVFLAPPLPPPPPPPLPKKPIGQNVMNDKTYMKKELQKS